MSQAEDLLNSLADGQAYIIDPSTEEHIVIGQDRKITVPQSLKRLAVQYDHNVETVTFDCPRYWDGVDMSKMYIYINYTRADKEVGMFKAENVAVDESDESTMHFTWTISRNVTEVKGNVVFIVCIKAVDEDGNETIHWNSELCNGCYISEGLECSEVIEEKYADIISQLLGITGISIDNELSLDSNDPVANKVIAARINEVEALIGANNDAILATASSYADDKTSESLAEAKVYTNTIASDVLTDAKDYVDIQRTIIDTNIDSKAEATLTDAKTYSDEVVATESSARVTGDADTLTEAKAYTDNKVLVSKNEWVAADIVVLEDAKEYTDDLVDAEAGARATGDSNTLTNAKKYTDEKISAEVTARESGDDITLASAKTYTDEKITDELAAVNTGDANTLASAKTYTDEKISAEVKSRNTADTNTLNYAKAYTDEREDVIEGVISTKDAATLASAKAYADEVVASEIGARTTGDTNTLASAKDYTDEKIAGLINGAPSTLDTLGEVATAMSENADVVQALDAAVGSKASDADLKAHVNDIENPHNVTKSQLGLGSVENKSSEDIRGELTKDNVVTALGYTPPKTDTTYTEATTEAAGLMSAEDKVKVGYLDNVTSDVQGQIDDLAGGLHHTNTTMQSQIDELSGEITNLNTDITDLNTDITDLNTDITDLGATVENNYTMLNANINSLAVGVEEHVDDLQGQIDSETLAVGVASGEYITVDDSTDGEVIELDISGKSTQVQYSGKNLLNCKLEATSSYGVTCTDNGDGTFTLNGTATSDASFFIFYDMTNMITVGETLKLVGCPSGGSGSSYYIVAHVNGTTWMTSVDSGNGVQIDSSDSISAINITVKSGKTASNLLFKPMLTTDLEATYDDFEPYCGGIPSPNPNYPQEITSVADGGSVEVVSCGKNLFNINGEVNIVGNDLTKVNPPQNVVSNSVLTCNVNGSNQHAVGQKITHVKGVTITLSAKILSLGTGNKAFIGIFENGRYIVYKNTDVGILTPIVYTPNSDEIVIGFATIGGTGAQFTDIQVEIGSTATPYEPYKESKATLQIEPLRSLPNGTKDELIFNRDGSGKIVRNVGEVVFDGSDDEIWKKNDDVSYNDDYIYSISKSGLGISTSSSQTCYCTHLNPTNQSGIRTENTICIYHNTYIDYIYVNIPLLFNNDSTINTTSKLKELLASNPVTVQYELATPVEETLTAEQINALLSLKTFESVTNMYSNDALQPELEMTYFKNTNIGKALAAGYKSNLATEVHDGLMSAEDKQKISEIDLNTLATAEASGEYITVEDAAGAPFSSFGMTGKSTQVQYSGKNLVNVLGETVTSYGITCTYNGDGTYTINGTAQSNGSQIVIGYIDSSLIGQTLKIVGCPANEDGAYLQVRAMAENDRGDGKTFTVSDTLNDSNNPVRICVDADATINNLVFKPMLTTDLDATYDDFEPYCGGIPSPNPDYPQEITSVADGGSVEVVSCGKNLFDVNGDVNIFGTTGEHTGSNPNAVSGNILTAGSNTATSHGWGQNIKVNVGDTITFSTKVLSFGSGIGVMIDIYENGNVVATKEYATLNGTCSVTYTAQSEELICTFRTYSGYNAQFTDIQVELGDTATSYEPYQGSEASLTLAEPLRSLPNGVADTVECNADGSYKIVRRVGSVVFDGSDDESYVLYSQAVHTGLTIYISNMKMEGRENGYCNNFLPQYSPYNSANNGVTFAASDRVLYLTFSEEKFTDLDGARSWLQSNPVTVHYELATPTEETLTAEQLSEILNLRTYESVSNINTNDSLQPNLNIEYYKNTNVGKACGDLKAQLNELKSLSISE